MSRMGKKFCSFEFLPAFLFFRPTSQQTFGHTLYTERQRQRQN